MGGFAWGMRRVEVSRGGFIIPVLTTHMYRYKRIDQDQNHHDTFDSSSLSFPLLFLVAQISDDSQIPLFTLPFHFLSPSLPPYKLKLTCLLYCICWFFGFRYACSALFTSSLVWLLTSLSPLSPSVAPTSESSPPYSSFSTSFRSLITSLS